MARCRLLIVCLKFLLWTAWFILCYSQNCAELDFPALNGSSTISVKENDTVTLLFSIRVKDNCSLPDSFLMVTHSDQTVCQMLQTNGACNDTGDICSCTKDNTFNFSRKFTRVDNGAWTWFTTQMKKTIEFIVL
ncbi:hypothetical protein BaRGS_00039679, partial [Batillaria attramentaria]